MNEFEIKRSIESGLKAIEETEDKPVEKSIFDRVKDYVLVSSTLIMAIGGTAVWLINSNNIAMQDQKSIELIQTELRDIDLTLKTLPVQNAEISQLMTAMQDQKATNGSVDNRLNGLSDRATKAETILDNLTRASGVKWR